MKNQLTDVDRFFAIFSVLAGTALAAFLAPVLGTDIFASAGIGLLLGLFAAFRIIRNPRKYSRNPDRQISKPALDDVVIKLAVNKLAKSYQADNPNSPYAKNSGEDESEEGEIISDSDLEELRDKLQQEMKITAKRKKAAYDHPIEINMEGRDEYDDLEDDPEEEADEYTEEDDTDREFSYEIKRPAYHRVRGGFFSKDISSPSVIEEEKPNWLITKLVSGKRLLSLIHLWSIAATILLEFFPVISSYVPKGAFLFFPQLFLVGLDGATEIIRAIRRNDDILDLETRPKIPFFAVVEIAFGWGLLVLAFATMN